MQIQCECGNFRAKLNAFPRNTPGRIVCYCDDCQAYSRYLNRDDLLDEHGGTEVIPAYPADVEFLDGQEHLRCTRLSPNGTFRFSTTCCNTPVASLRAGFPWVSFPRGVYNNGGDADAVDQALGPVRSRIMGAYATGTPPAGTPKKFNIRGGVAVLLFLLKGKLQRKTTPSPFFGEDGETPVVAPYILSKAERTAGRTPTQRA